MFWCYCYRCVVFFFFKQKTAYEMRISDWSSDVCSSDLVALTGERLEELKRGASMAKTCGLAVEVLSPQDIAGMYPLLNLDSVTGGVFLPKDGQADPAHPTHALAKAARQNGPAIVAP